MTLLKLQPELEYLEEISVLTLQWFQVVERWQKHCVSCFNLCSVSQPDTGTDDKGREKLLTAKGGQSPVSRGGRCLWEFTVCLWQRELINLIRRGGAPEIIQIDHSCQSRNGHIKNWPTPDPTSPLASHPPPCLSSQALFYLTFR